MTQSSTSKVIKPAWESVWNALQGWKLWTEKIQSFIATDDDVKNFIRSEASLSRVPMVTAAWDASTPSWWVYSQQKWEAPLRISVYVPRDRHSLSMDLIEDAIDAVYRFEAPNSTAAAPVPLVKSLLCRDPELLQFQTGLPVDAGAEGQHKLLHSFVVVRLTLRKDPKIRGT